VSGRRWLLGAALAAVFAGAGSLILWVRLGSDFAFLVGPSAAAMGAVLFLLPSAVAAGWPPGGLVAAALFASMLTFCLGLAAPTDGPLLATAIRLAAVTGLLVYLLGALALLVAPAVGSADAALAWLAFGITVLGASPVWLAPVIDLASFGTGTLDALVAVNPLTHFAVAAQTDYLRHAWFYHYSPLGSLRYDYPSEAATLAAYLIAGLLATWAGYRNRPSQQGQAPRPLPDLARPASGAPATRHSLRKP